jgi:hypothetical protein
MVYIIKGNLTVETIGGMTISELLFADDLAVAKFIINGLRTEIDQVVKYCRDRKLKLNLNKTEIFAFKREERLNKKEGWTTYYVDETELFRSKFRK